MNIKVGSVVVLTDGARTYIRTLVAELCANLCVPKYIDHIIPEDINTAEVPRSRAKGGRRFPAKPCVSHRTSTSFLRTQ